MGQFLKLQFRAGINRENTAFANEGGWRDCDKIRFKQGYPESIGGWSRLSGATFLGVARNLFPWRTLSGTYYLGVGTHLKYYINAGGPYHDITPLRETTSAGDVTFQATNGSSTLRVDDLDHGAGINDFVTFSGAVSLGGNVTADELNKEFQITAIVDEDAYEVELAVTANASDTGNGGGAVVGEYQIITGKKDALVGTGWGAGVWGGGGWGTAEQSGSILANLRTWSHDNFGEDLVINPYGEGVYYWDATSGLSARAVALSDLAGAEDAPTVANRVLVSDQDRHLIVFGCDPATDPGNIDPLLVRWSDQENAADWQVLSTNTAGFQRLGSGTSILSAVQTKREIVIFTDQALYSMQFIGPPYTFGFHQLGGNVRLAGQNAMVAVDDVIYWMDDSRFMRYDGTIQEILCPVESHVFDNLTENQRAKVVAGSNSEFSEVWWFYPTGNENDRYVVFNYQENVWYYGTMTRTAWVDARLGRNPIAASTDMYLYYHEIGLNDGSTEPESSIHSWVESSSTDIAEGDKFMFAKRILPDLTFKTSTGMPQATFTVKAREFPGDGFEQEDDETAVQTATTPVETWTRWLDIRIRGRSYAVRVESDGLNTAWRLGVPRIDVKTDGRK